jgi:hypothetical protein
MEKRQFAGTTLSYEFDQLTNEHKFLFMDFKNYIAAHILKEHPSPERAKQFFDWLNRCFLREDQNNWIIYGKTETAENTDKQGLPFS